MNPGPSKRLDRALAALRADPSVEAAEERIHHEDDRTIRTQIEISEIAAPPFGEGERGRRVAELFRAAGLSDVRTDDVGNVLGWCGGRAAAPSAALVVSAHLDTVFPEGTDVRVRRDGAVLRGPGISDDARGLATLLTLARILPDVRASDTDRPVLFVATVGEEGAGDLRGVKHLFGPEGAAAHAAGFVSLDGAGLDRIVLRGLGSRRFRIRARGPGGHSWVDWGSPNPIHALGSIVARLTELSLSRDPVTTLTVARWGGGKSINAIPQAAWVEIDTRSESDERLTELEAEIRRVVADEGTDGSDAPPSGDAARTEDRLTLSIESIGVRPGGRTAQEATLVQAALAATRAAGRVPQIALSSTDANIPMALGIPAVTLGCGGEAGGAHTTDEWYRNVLGPEGVVRALHTALLARNGDDA